MTEDGGSSGEWTFLGVGRLAKHRYGIGPP
jgi:hypothetical protein